MNEKIEFIYFDVGGVALIDFSKNEKWNEMAHDLGITDSTFEAFRNVFKENESALCGGGDSHYVKLTKLLQTNLGITFPDGYDMLTDFVSRFDKNDSIHSLVGVSAGKFKIGLLTNMYPNMLDKIMESHLLPDVDWDVIIDSSVVGASKPMEEIFITAEERANVAPESIFFVENTAGHIDVAKNRGWQTFLYDPADLEGSNEELKSVLGL